jgi:uncharacterized protein (TIGR02996 family)
MTTEDDFQRALDANPDDWQTRLVFADWLQERDDPRAEGYRAMGLWRLAPTCWPPGESRSFPLWGWPPPWVGGSATLPADWYVLLPQHASAAGVPAERRTAREASDDALGAFAQLPAWRRAELLAAPPDGDRAGWVSLLLRVSE